MSLASSRSAYGWLQKAAYCHALAWASIEGRIDLAALSEFSDHAVRSALVALPGIGPWTADIYLLMALRRVDVWPQGDLALAIAAQRVKGLSRRPGSEQLSRMAMAWSPWRAVAARILWHFYLSAKVRQSEGPTVVHSIPRLGSP